MPPRCGRGGRTRPFHVGSSFDFVADRRHAPLYELELEVSELLTELPIGVRSRFFQRVRLPEILIETAAILGSRSRDATW